jgi:hypothetical protein
LGGWLILKTFFIIKASLQSNLKGSKGHVIDKNRWMLSHEEQVSMFVNNIRGTKKVYGEFGYSKCAYVMYYFN